MSLVLYELMSAIFEAKQRYKLEAETLKMTKQHMEELKDIYTRTAKYKHDIKHQLHIIEQMVADGDTEAGRRYFGSLKADDTVTNTFTTGCISVDALLTVKSIAMRENNIDFKITLCPLDELPIKEYDFCAILGNILDNAIEGVCRITTNSAERSISLKFTRSWDVFCLVCRNNIDVSNITRWGNDFVSSKHNYEHGYGIASIRSIVKNYSGSSEFGVEDTMFRVEIVLPYGGKNINDK